MFVRTDSSQLSLYDLGSLQKQAQYDFPTRVAVAHFSPDGHRLLVVTADQTAYIFDVSASQAKAAEAAGK